MDHMVLSKIIVFLLHDGCVCIYELLSKMAPMWVPLILGGVLYEGPKKGTIDLTKTHVQRSIYVYIYIYVYNRNPWKGSRLPSTAASSRSLEAQGNALEPPNQDSQLPTELGTQHAGMQI